MKKAIFTFCMLAFSVLSFGQSVKELQETASTFMQQGDFVNAILVLNRATKLEPENIAVMKSLAMAYNYQKDDVRALPIIKKVLESEEADDQSFQIAGNIYKNLSQPKEAEKVYKKGLKKFPSSGPLYCEYGELLMAQQDYTAIKLWEKGIENDPGYSKNYFNAAKYYYLTTDPVWTVLYGELFILMEPYGNRTPEMKEVVLDGYKKMFANTQVLENTKNRNEFEQAYISTVNKQSAVAGYGISADPLTMIRSRFILDWDNSNYQTKFSFKLFDLHRELLQQGLFEMYNQWLFGSIENLSEYQNYTSLHKSEYGDFSKLIKGRIYKQPNGQYYHKIN